MNRTRLVVFPALVAAFSAVCLWSSHAEAVITQVDGQVLPQSDRLQIALDRSVAEGGEGKAGLVHSVFDAAVTPELFQIPEEGGKFRKVGFHYIEHGGGYLNAFGWYDISMPKKLNIVIDCYQDKGYKTEVDFQKQFIDGNYKGGLVGFFLISPGASSVCGNEQNLNDPNAPAFIVYTESQLNGDGNYVHYLHYQSKQNPLAYYFGFEDLWRGGDNDFEDMAVKVTGLVKPCEPSPEICDGLDNNCDGLIDNDPVDVGTECTKIVGNTPGVGPCRAGLLVCASTGPGDTTKQCVGEIGPSVEICDGLDNNCNGIVDDNPTDPSIGDACGGSSLGECKLGKKECIAGTIACVGVVGPAPELCDGFDNDCDGVVDGTAADPVQPCTHDADCPASAPFCLMSAVTGNKVCAAGPIDVVGQCTISGSTCPGVRRCEGGAIVCKETAVSMPEICNGADDNCNGLIDEGDPGGGALCAPGGITMEMATTGQCLPGTIHCLGGTLKCVGGREPTPEICDGLDNDCDGVADNAAECPGENKCVEGVCVEPCSGGEFPCPSGLVCVDGYCVKAPAGTGGSSGAGGSAGAAGAAGKGGGSGGSGGAGKGGSAGTGQNLDAGLDGSQASGGQDPWSPPPQHWGLTTGGGGVSCAMSSQSRSAVSIGLFGLFTLLLGARRGSARSRNRRG